MGSPDLPRDWRSALLVAAMAISGVLGLRAWVVSIAQAEDASQKQAIVEMKAKVDAMYASCLRQGQCDPVKEAK